MKFPLYRSWRLVITLEVLVGTALLMYYRMAMSITLICMVPAKVNTYKKPGVATLHRHVPVTDKKEFGEDFRGNESNTNNLNATVAALSKPRNNSDIQNYNTLHDYSNNSFPLFFNDTDYYSVSNKLTEINRSFDTTNITVEELFVLENPFSTTGDFSNVFNLSYATPEKDLILDTLTTVPSDNLTTQLVNLTVLSNNLTAPLETLTVQTDQLNVTEYLTEPLNDFTLQSENLASVNKSVNFSYKFNWSKESIIKHITAPDGTPSYSYTFDWSKEFQGYLLSSFFYGMTIGMPLGGYLCNVLPNKTCLIMGVLWSAALSAFIPYAAMHNRILLLVIRAFQGLGNGIGLPSHVGLLANWSTGYDMNLLLCIAFLGFSYGNLVSLHLSSLLCVYGPFGGWPSVYYMLAVVGVLYCIVTELLVSETPYEHPYITEEEIRYMEYHRSNAERDQESKGSGDKEGVEFMLSVTGAEKLNKPLAKIITEERVDEAIQLSKRRSSLLPIQTVDGKTITREELRFLLKQQMIESYSSGEEEDNDGDLAKVIEEDEVIEEEEGEIHEGDTDDEGDEEEEKLHWKNVFCYPPVLAVYFANFCATYGWTTFGINQPLFMRDLFGFPIEENALASSLPWLAHTPTCAMVSLAMTHLVHYMTLTNVRKSLTTAGFLLAALIPVIAIEVTFFNRWASSVFLLLTEIGNAMAFTGGYLYSVVDMSPRHSSTLAGVGSTFLGLSGLISPVVTGLLTPTGSLGEWRKVFYLSAFVYFCGAVVFLLFGSSNPEKFSSYSHYHTCKSKEARRKRRIRREDTAT